MKIKRRRFVRETARAAVAAGALGAADHVLGETAAGGVSPERRLLPIVDTHQHLWDLRKLRLPWLKPGGPLTRSFLTKDYLQAIEGLNVAKAVYMEVDVDPKQLIAEAEHVIELCRRSDNPTCAAVIGGRPAAEDFKPYITRFKDSPYVKGIRRLLFQPEPCLEKPFVAGMHSGGQLEAVGHGTEASDPHPLGSRPAQAASRQRRRLLRTGLIETTALGHAEMYSPDRASCSGGRGGFT